MNQTTLLHFFVDICECLHFLFYCKCARLCYICGCAIVKVCVLFA